MIHFILALVFLSMLKNDFCKLKAKKMFCNKNFTQSFTEMLQITLILQENKQYGQTTQKPKLGQKVENIENHNAQSWTTLFRAFSSHRQPSAIFFKGIPS